MHLKCCFNAIFSILQGLSFMCCRLNVYRSALILRNLPRREKFLVRRLKHKIRLCKRMLGIFDHLLHLDFIGLIDDNEKNRKATVCFAPKHLIFKLQQEFGNFNIIFVSYSSPKTWPGDELFKLRKSKFWIRVTFSP